MPRFMRVAGATHELRIVARGSHALLFMDDDHPELLKAAQPYLKWDTVTSGADTLHTLPYHEFVRLIGGVLRIPGLGYPDKSFRTSTVDAPALDRSWKALLGGMTDWTPCKPGAFDARIRAAASNSLVPSSAFELLDADFYTIPSFTDEALPELAWSTHLTFTPGALADTSVRRHPWSVG